MLGRDNQVQAMAVQTEKLIKVQSPAKINLTFEILAKFPDGYHEVRTLLQAISLADDLEFKFANSEGQNEQSRAAANELPCPRCIFKNVDFTGWGDFPLDESNLIVKAIRAYQNVVPQARKLDVEISIKKRIPLGSGMAGGSTNAAAALVAINRACGDALALDKLMEVGALIGADVPFALRGGTCLGINRGDRLAPVENQAQFFFFIAKPHSINISTPWAYGRYDELNATICSDTTNGGSKHTTTMGDTNYPDTGSGAAIGNQTEVCIAGLRRGDIKAVSEELVNYFEPVVFQAHPGLGRLRRLIEDFAGMPCRLTGSGPTLYTLLLTRGEAETVANRLDQWQQELKGDCADTIQDLLPLDCFIAESVCYGTRVIED